MGLPIRTKLAVFIVCIIGILGTATILFVRHFVYRGFSELQLEKANVIGTTIVDYSVEDLLIEDVINLQKRINETKNGNAEILYIFFTDKSGSLLVDTFRDRAPPALLDYIKKKTSDNFLLDTEMGLIRHFVMPISDGHLGFLHIGLSEKNIRRNITKALNVLFLIMSAFLMVSLIAAYLISRKIIVPLTVLDNSIREAGTGNYGQRVEINSSDEIGNLAFAFNRMMDNLEKSKNELASAQEKLMQNIKMATIGQLSAGIAHEVNNPLGAMIHSTRTLLANPQMDTEWRRHLELILKGLFRIENIIKQILLFSKRQRIEPKRTKVNNLVSGALHFVEHKLSEKNISLNTDIAEDLPDALVDANQIQQVFINVLNNSIDAMPDRGAIKIRACLNERGVEITFTDNGTGISNENMEKIFSPFFTTKDAGKGVGLGLFVSYNIIQSHKGMIDVESAEGRGTTVKVILPVTKE